MLLRTYTWLCCSVRGFLFKIKQIQRAWRTFKTMQKAQVVVVAMWLTNLRSTTIKRRKQLEQEMKDHKDTKQKAKAGKDKKEPPFGGHCVLKTVSFCQDRLGTNTHTGEVEKRVALSYRRESQGR